MVEKKIDIEELVNAISGLTLLEAGELADMLKERLGIQDMPMGVVNAGSSEGGKVGDDTPAKEDFDLILQSFGQQKTQVIKAVREIKKKEGEEIGLKDAKELVETPDAKICVNIPKAKAEEYSKILQGVGAESKLN